MMKNIAHQLAKSRFSIQVVTISFLSFLLFFPRIQADTFVTPTVLPTNTDVLRSALPTIPPTPDFNNAAREQLAGLTNMIPTSLPRSLRDASGDNSANIVGDSTQFTSNAMTGVLGDNGFPSVDPVAASRGDPRAFARAGVTDPLMLSQLASGSARTAQDIATQRATSVLQVEANIGIVAPADCSTSNDTEGVSDLCSKMEEVKRTIDEAKSEANAALTIARQIRTYVSNKPAFLSAPSIKLPVCLALVTDGPGIDYDEPDIAVNPTAYDPAAALVSMEAIRAQLTAPSEEMAANAARTNDPLGATRQASQSGADDYAQSLARRQHVYDDLYARAVTNFKQDQQSRYNVLQSHGEELTAITDAIVRVATALNLRLPTP